MRRMVGVLVAGLALSACAPGAIEGALIVPPADRDLACGGRRVVAVPFTSEVAGLMAATATGTTSGVDLVMRSPVAGSARTATCEGTRFRIEGLTPGSWAIFIDPRVAEDGRVMQVTITADVAAGETKAVGALP